MLKKVLMGLAVVVVGFVGFVATRPSKWHVERSATLTAPPGIVFLLVNDFHRWAEWSPWDKRDPSQKTTFEGAAAGKGAIYKWDGNDEVGSGQMTLEESTPVETIRIKLEFTRPFKALNTTTFTFKPAENAGTQVTWAIDGEHDFLGKLFSVFTDMDAMLGKDFNDGLSALGKAAEAETKRQEEARMAAEAEEARKAAEAAAAAAAATPEGQPTPTATP